MDKTHADIDEVYEWFLDFLDDACEPLIIGNLTYNPSEAFKAVDPIAFEVAFQDYVESVRQDGILVYD